MNAKNIILIALLSLTSISLCYASTNSQGCPCATAEDRTNASNELASAQNAYDADRSAANRAAMNQAARNAEAVGRLPPC